MIRNYITIALRQLKRNRVYSAINLVGLAIGIASGLLVIIFIQDELKFDDFQSDGDSIYRLNKVVATLVGDPELHAITSGMMGPTLAEEFAEIEQSVRLLPWFDDMLMTAGEDYMRVSDVVFADAELFDMFDYELLLGDDQTALQDPMSIVLSQSTAERMFGLENPIGKSIEGPFDEKFQVTGVVKDAPLHAHLRYNAFISWSSTVPGVGRLSFSWMNKWLTQVNYTYLKVAPSADLTLLEAQFPDFMMRHFAERADRYKLYLQPFNEIYLQSSNVLYSRGLRLGSQIYVQILSIIAVLILLIAAINFVNLSLARAGKRSREIGVRKSLGANRLALVGQFLTESMLQMVLASAIAILLTELALPFLNNLTDKSIELNYFGQASHIFMMATGIIVLGILSGLYPASVYSSLRTTTALRGDEPSNRKGSLSRRSLVTIQFSIAITLAIGALHVFNQVDYMLAKDLGFQKEQVIVLPIGGTEISEQYQAFKNEILQYPGVHSGAGSNAVPGSGMMSFGFYPEGALADEEWTVSTIRVDDYDLTNVYDLEMAKGRYFSAEFTSDQEHAIVINETFAKTLGWSDPIGKQMQIRGEIENGRVIGVVKDFYLASLHRPIESLAIVLAPRYEMMSVRVDPEQMAATITALKAKWELIEPIAPFEYEFLDETFAQLYADEQRLMATIGVFSGMAIIIAALGLLGLAAFSAERRTKEIGIRKVVGATVGQVVRLLTSDFAWPVIYANVIAWPLSWVLMNRWLNNFAYRIDVDPKAFFIVGMIALLVATTTVGSQAYKAARANPVDALRYE